MNCAWCRQNADGSGSHGICESCAKQFSCKSAMRQFDRVASYVEENAARFAEECMLKQLSMSDR